MGEQIEGRNPVMEALRSGRRLESIFLLEGTGTLEDMAREAAKRGIPVKYISRSRLDGMSQTPRHNHQGVIAVAPDYRYASLEQIQNRAKEKGEPPFLFLLDHIQDPQNLGAIIRTANVVGAHGVIIPDRRGALVTTTVEKTSAGAVNYTPVAKVANLARTVEELKKQGIWCVCADMDGKEMYDLDLTGPICLVIGNEGKGVSSLVREKCDLRASIPMRGDIDSLNASVAAGVLAYEIFRQRRINP